MAFEDPRCSESIKNCSQDDVKLRCKNNIRKCFKKWSTWLQNWSKMEPKLAPKSMKNRFQEALNKNDEKWNQKSHAGVCGGARGCAAQGLGGPLKSINPVSPEGPEGQPDALGHSPRAQGGTVADRMCLIARMMRSLMPLRTKQQPPQNVFPVKCNWKRRWIEPGL